MPVRPKYQGKKLNFKRPNDEFAILQNVAFDLRTSDGDFANVKLIAIEKRLGTSKYGNEISTSGGIPTLLSYTNNTRDFLISGNDEDLYTFVEDELALDYTVGDTTLDLVDATAFATSGTIYIDGDEIQYTGKVANQLMGVFGASENHLTGDRVIQRIWRSIINGLTPNLWWNGVSMQSYSGVVVKTGTVNDEYTGTWTAVSYDPTTDFTTLSDATATWQADDLIARKVEPNTGDFPDKEYTIIENGTNYIRIEGNIQGGNTTTTTGIAFTTLAAAVALTDVSITLTDGSGFPTGGGTINIENDIVTYASRVANVLSGISGLNIGHPSGAVVTSGEVTLVSTTGFGQSGAVRINGDTIYFNDKIGNKLLNLSNISQAYAIGATVTDANYVARAGSSYIIRFVSVANRLVDTSASFIDDEYEGSIVVLTAGKGVGQQRKITSNTQDNLVIAFPWEEEPDSTTGYDIHDGEDQIFYMGNGVDDMIRFDGDTATQLLNVPKGNIMMAYKSRLFIVDSMFTVKYSDPGDPEYFPVFHTITPPGDDRITGLGEWNGNGIIFKERSIWRFNFQFNEATSIFDIVLDQIPSNSGCVSHRTIHKVENVLWYFDGKSVRYLGSAPNQIGVIRTEEVSFPLQEKMAQIPKNNWEDIVAFFDDNNYLMFSRETSDSTENDIGFDYDITYTSWATRTGNNAMSVAYHHGTRFYGDSEAGQVFEMDVINLYNDDDQPVDMIVVTKDDDMGDAALFKTYRFTEVGFENEDGSVEYSNKVYTTRYTLTRDGNWDLGFGLNANATIAQGATFGQGVFGTLSEAPRRIIRKISVGQQGTRTQLVLRNRQLDEKITITDIAHIWHTRPMRHFPSVLIS